MGFKENLKSELQYANMSIKELAFRSGIKKATIESYLGGQKCIPSVTAAISIAKALNLSVEYLVEGKDSGNSRPLSSLPQDIQTVVHELEQLNTKDRHIMLTLAQTLRER